MSKPVLFNGDMVRALLGGRKTQTRRVVSMHNSYVDGYRLTKRSQFFGAAASSFWNTLDFGSDRVFVDGGPSPAGNPGPYLHVPYPPEGSIHRIYPEWQPGDLLWVREAWNAIRFSTDYETGICDEVFTAPRIPTGPNDLGGRYEIAYAADLPDEGVEDRGFAFRPSIHMPRWASRITLRITDVRVERLQDISPADAIAEGIPAPANSITIDCATPNPADAFGKRWQAIYGTWNDNPWVWVIAFEVIRKNIDEVTA